MISRLTSDRPLERWGLLALLLFTVVAVAGYWTFALNPQRLAAAPGAARFYAVSFQFFARLHILLSAAALGAVLVGRLRGRWIPALGAVYALSFLAEHVGTGFGFPFGGYEYTGLLGQKLGGRVPALIPLSWFLMALPAFVLARRAFPGSPVRRVVVASALLVAWDLALDPAMSYLTPYWIWESPGPYYGMPWINLAGWFVTGVAIMAALERLLGADDVQRLPAAWMGSYYLVVLLMPLGMLVAAGHWPAVAVTLAAVGALGWLVRGAWNEAVPLPSESRGLESHRALAEVGS